MLSSNQKFWGSEGVFYYFICISFLVFFYKFPFFQNRCLSNEFPFLWMIRKSDSEISRTAFLFLVLWSFCWHNCLWCILTPFFLYSYLSSQNVNLKSYNFYASSLDVFLITFFMLRSAQGFTVFNTILMLLLCLRTGIYHYSVYQKLLLLRFQVWFFFKKIYAHFDLQRNNILAISPPKISIIGVEEIICCHL